MDSLDHSLHYSDSVILSDNLESYLVVVSLNKNLRLLCPTIFIRFFWSLVFRNQHKIPLLNIEKNPEKTGFRVETGRFYMTTILCPKRKVAWFHYTNVPFWPNILTWLPVSRVVSILQKSWYLKCQVMGSSTLLTGMFMQIFKPVALKQRSRGIAQFY